MQIVRSERERRGWQSHKTWLAAIKTTMTTTATKIIKYSCGETHCLLFSLPRARLPLPCPPCTAHAYTAASLCEPHTPSNPRFPSIYSEVRLAQLETVKSSKHTTEYKPHTHTQELTHTEAHTHSYTGTNTLTLI